MTSIRQSITAAIQHHQAGRVGQAEAIYRQILSQHPNNPDALHLLGAIAFQAGKFSAAIELILRAIAVNPAVPDYHSNLAKALREKNHFDEAILACRQAIALKPDFFDAYNNLGYAYLGKGELDAALAAYRQALRLSPDSAVVHWNIGLILLLRGDYAEGLPEHECRWEWEGFSARPPKFPQPMWDGRTVKGQTILLHAEQGFGDTIQFVRYAPMVADRGAHVIVACQPQLVRLLQGTNSLGQIISIDEALPSFDFHCPLASLPLLFETRVNSIPASVPYLNPDQSLMEKWRAKLNAFSDGLKVGLAWAGNPTFHHDRERSLDLKTLAPLAAVPNIMFFSLQKGEREIQSKNPPSGMKFFDLGPELIDFADTAAAMSSMDLIITTDTSVAHLAGALARPVWVLLQCIPDWRWMLDREDSPWYPTMRLFRQPANGDWNSVIKRMIEALSLWTRNRK